MSGIKDVIIDIRTKLESLAGDGGPFKHTGVWTNQLEYLENGTTYSFPLPCCFVEIVDPTFRSLGGGYRQADLEIRIHIGHEYYNAADGRMEENLDYFDLRDLITETFHLYQPVGCGHMLGNSDKYDIKHTNVYHGVVAFIVGFIDSKGSRKDPAVYDKYYQKKTTPTDVVINVTEEIVQYLLTEDSVPITDNGNDIYQQKILTH